ncbi:MAG: hypothetical protein QE277_08330 [Flectobacillus sp.]|nr:hypothetical protein [Flectobacillus sp.]
MKISNNQFSILEKAYIKAFTPILPDSVINDYKLVLEHQYIIKCTKPNKKILNSLLDIVIEKISNNQRFQKDTFLQLIKWHRDSKFIDEEISEKLFLIFKSLITDSTQQLSEKLNRLVMNIALSPENINWLIENISISEYHITNRMLRYPKANYEIYRWAVDCLKHNYLHERSEIIGIILDFENDFMANDSRKMVWGIHYSHLDKNVKQELLIKNITVENIEDVIKICEKNSFIDVIDRLYQTLAIAH